MAKSDGSITKKNCQKNCENRTQCGPSPHTTAALNCVVELEEKFTCCDFTSMAMAWYSQCARVGSSRPLDSAATMVLVAVVLLFYRRVYQAKRPLPRQQQQRVYGYDASTYTTSVNWWPYLSFFLLFLRRACLLSPYYDYIGLAINTTGMAAWPLD